MGPSCRRRTRSTRKSSSRRTLFKKKSQNSKKNQEIPVVSSPSSTSPSKPSSNDSLKIDSGSIDCDQSIDMLSTSSSCSTPKAERFRIPEIKTCPPAPKKRRIVTSCSLRRSPIAFFDPPDIELFFYFALRGISA
ncbi:cyclin-dependent protein kinase inhibitor SMR9-like [Forsythia ovata]|uniref:Cyclin-dependent protein kinase inhibitor SMR9-like n=1 Tax=Forsythia ovata TaxID=205694 RepID=A0ABD1VEN4_9LAMI